MISNFKYSETKSTKAKMRRVVVLGMTDKSISGIDLTKLSKEEAKACRKIKHTPNSGAANDAFKPYMKAFRRFNIESILK